jgi:multisubunit Na+/H+ antiporter MnhC subunit
MEQEEPIVSIILFVPRALVVTKNVIGLCVTMVVTLVALAFEETAEKAKGKPQ